MKRINRLRVSLYKDILFTLILVLISIPIWLSFNIRELEDAKKYDNYNYINYEYLNNPKHEIVSASDDYALRNIETQDLIVYNYTKADANYSLVLKIDKLSTLVIDDIKLNVNYTISYLKDFKYYEDNDYYYYIIDSDHLKGDSQKYILSMWNDKKEVLDSNNTFNYEFIIL